MSDHEHPLSFPLRGGTASHATATDSTPPRSIAGSESDFEAVLSAHDAVERLSAQEEANLGWNVQRGKCIVSHDRLVRANMYLVASIVRQYRDRGHTLAELIECGTLGLNEAVSQFDPSEGARFSRGARWWIKRAILRSLAGRPEIRTIRLAWWR
jgi:DNA-directed RNA polymerase sigma subunit (sigma70/sigma32)